MSQPTPEERVQAIVARIAHNASVGFDDEHTMLAVRDSLQQELAAAFRREKESGSRPIEEAPKEGYHVLLWFPEFGPHTAAWWTGRWSIRDGCWAIVTPYIQGENRVDCPMPDIHPTHFKPLPGTPRKALAGKERGE